MKVNEERCLSGSRDSSSDWSSVCLPMGLIIGEPSLAGLCGAIGLFLGSVAILLGLYHRYFVRGALVASLVVLLPAIGAGLLLMWSGSERAAVAVSAGIGIAVYAALYELNRKLSGLSFEMYLSQLASDEVGEPKPGWQSTVVWLLAVLGGLVGLLVMSER